MRHIQNLFCFILLATSLAVKAQDTLPVDINNYLRIEYDDNVFTANEDVPGGVQESFVIVEQVEFILDSLQDNSYYGLRYSPLFKYYTDRPSDDTDLNHEWDLSFSHDFSPRSSFYLNHILRVTEEPLLETGDVVFRNRNDYMYNSVTAEYVTQVVPEKTSLQVSGRFADFSYDDDQIAEVSDYQQITGGLNVMQILKPDLTASGQLRYTDLDYEADFRDAETYQAGFAMTKIFNPKLTANVRGGVEFYETDDTVSDDSESPYVEISTTYQPVKGTRLKAGVGYRLDKSPVSIFSMQERFSFIGSYSNELTAKTTFILRGTYSLGDFSTDNATEVFDPELDSAGDESILTLSTSLRYNLDVQNALVLRYQFTELESDVRPASDYDRNQISFGWQYSL